MVIRFLQIALTFWCLLYISHVLDYIGILLSPVQQQAIFLGTILALTFLVFPARKERPGVKWYDWILMLMGVVPSAYVVFFNTL
jgi:TRAP-type uncharacterized transport system fused permease subunit